MRPRPHILESDKRRADSDLAVIPTSDEAVVLEMATCRFLAETKNWIVHGPTGVGKSHLATAIGREAIPRGYFVLGCSPHKLRADLFAARADGSYHRKKNRLPTVSPLTLDDFGLRPLPPQGTDDLYEIIHRCYERGSTLLTSNQNPCEWAELFEDSLLASGARDGLTHHARITAISAER